MKNIGINVNSSKDNDNIIVNHVLKMLKEAFPDSTFHIFKDGEGLEDSKDKNLDVLVALGGDGTILRTARKIYNLKTPILGVNIGHLGFLASVEMADLNEAIEKLKAKKFKICDRMMLNVTIPKMDGDNNHVALNDVVITKGTLSRMLTFDLYVDDSFYIKYKADGIIFSTPTGSTAYSLSAGGPIIYPTLNLINITPICPNSNGVKTMILDEHNKITLKINSNGDNVFLSCDGQLELKTNEFDEMIIEAKKEKCRLIEFNDYDYFKILRKKIIARSMDCEET